MNHMFFAQEQFNGNLSSWNVGQVTDFGGMFRQCDAFNGDLSGWDVSQATDMNLMFETATVFNGDISDWDVSSVTKMNDMFLYAAAFNQDLSSWDVSSVTNMYRMFAYSGFDGADGEIVGNTWTTTQVITAQQMFIGNTAWTAKHEILSGNVNNDGPPSRWGKKSTCPVNYYVKSNVPPPPAGYPSPPSNYPPPPPWSPGVGVLTAGVCAPCPAGSANPAGDDVTGVDTLPSCSPIICAQNERVQSNACVACLTDAVRPAGDDATGPDTSCTCTENYHVCKVSYDPGGYNPHNPYGGLDPPSYVSDSGSCKACPAGTTRAAGDDPASAATACDYTPCAENEFVADRTDWANGWGNALNNPGGLSANPAISSFCPGSTINTLGDIHKFECKACPTSFANAAGDDPATFSSAGRCTCPVNTYGELWTAKCTACPDGTAAAAGDKAPSGTGIGACRPITCAENERLQNNTCVSKLCGAYERVQDNACVACPPGTINAPGDDPAGADTACDARGCPLDHHVVNKTCVECGEGLTNLAGDDESGDDTECRGYGSGAGDVYGEWSVFTALAVAFAAAILC
jgi:surface protein